MINTHVIEFAAQGHVTLQYHTLVGGTSHIRTITCADESRHTYERVTSQHTNKSRDAACNSAARTRTRPRANTYTHTHTHTHRRWMVHHIHTHTHTHAHTHTHTHTPSVDGASHTYIHTHTHTHTRIPSVDGASHILQSQCANKPRHICKCVNSQHMNESRYICKRVV